MRIGEGKGKGGREMEREGREMGWREGVERGREKEGEG